MLYARGGKLQVRMGVGVGFEVCMQSGALI